MKNKIKKLVFYFFFIIALNIFCCSSETFSISTDESKVVGEQETTVKKKYQEYKLIKNPPRKSVTSSPIVWNKKIEVIKEQFLWQREFELKINFYVAKLIEKNIKKANFFYSEYNSLKNIIKKKNIHSGIPVEKLRIIEIKKEGIKKYYADKKKIKISKEVFFEKKESIFIFSKDNKKTNKITYFKSNPKLIKENIYLKNGDLDRTVIHQNFNKNNFKQNNKNIKWAIYAAYYRKKEANAKHINSISIPLDNSFKNPIDAIYGIQGTIRATFNRPKINTSSTIKNAIFNNQHLKISKINLLKKASKKNNFFKNSKRRSISHDVMKIIFSFEDWKVPISKNKIKSRLEDYDDGELTILVGKKKENSLENFNKMWEFKNTKNQNIICNQNYNNNRICDFSDMIFAPQGLGISIEAWKHYMKSKSVLKPKNNYRTKLKTSYILKNHKNKLEKVVSPIEIFYFLQEVVFENKFNLLDKNKKIPKKSIVFFKSKEKIKLKSYIDIWNNKFKYGEKKLNKNDSKNRFHFPIDHSNYLVYSLTF